MPNFVVWKENYSVGFPKLDQQHKNILALLNKLYAGLQDGLSKQAIVDLLTELQQYGQLHLGLEESLMQACNYPDVEAHCQFHTSYKERLENLRRDLALNEEISHELFRFLKEWWIHHIVNVDQKYSPFLRSQP